MSTKAGILLKSVWAVVLLASCTSGLVKQNFVERDYAQYLADNPRKTALPKTKKVSNFDLTPNTQHHRYSFRTEGIKGYTSVWVVEFGEMLDNTLMSSDVQQAFGTMLRLPKKSAKSGNYLVFDLQEYSFDAGSATVRLDVAFFQNGQWVFSKQYGESGSADAREFSVDPETQQRRTVQFATRVALDGILRKVINDVNNPAAVKRK